MDLNEINAMFKPKRGRPRKGSAPRHPKSYYKKQGFLFMYDFCCGNILMAAKHAHVSNKSFYNWMRTDPWFAGKIKDLDDEMEKIRLQMLEDDPEYQATLRRIEKRTAKFEKMKAEIQESVGFV